jgi:hypothetical protein
LTSKPTGAIISIVIRRDNNMKKKYKIVLDVETTGDVNNALVYDLGYIVCDLKGNVYEKRSYVINDIFFKEEEKMRSAYYVDKLPQYYKGLADKKWEKIDFIDMWKEFNEIVEKYGVTSVCAYNCDFDKRALNNTMKYLSNGFKTWFFPYGLEFECIWSQFCQTYANTIKYIKWAIENNQVSPSGNVKTNAECAYNYLMGRTDFEECHTGLEDVKIELFIMLKCLKYGHGKLFKGINRRCWNIPNKKKKEKGL